MPPLLSYDDTAGDARDLGWIPEGFAAALGRYVAEVARAVAADPAGCLCAAGDIPATAYIALDQRPAEHPADELALIWDEHRGWRLVLETTASTDLTELAQLGNDPVPAPDTVAAALATAGYTGGTAPTPEAQPHASPRHQPAARRWHACPHAPTHDQYHRSPPARPVHHSKDRP